MLVQRRCSHTDTQCAADTHVSERKTEYNSFDSCSLTHPLVLFHTETHKNLVHTHCQTDTARVWSPVIALTQIHCPTARESQREREREKRLKGRGGRQECTQHSFVWGKWWMRWRDVMTWLIAQTLNEKQHSTDVSLSLFKRDSTSPANPVRIPRSHPHNSLSFFPNHIPHCLSFFPEGCIFITLSSSPSILLLLSFPHPLILFLSLICSGCMPLWTEGWWLLVWDRGFVCDERQGGICLGN